jgi:simple sugar transport system ATP-binding protein
MTGRDVALGERTSESAPGAEILRLEGVTVTTNTESAGSSTPPGRARLVVGWPESRNGQNELIDTITGLKAANQGTILINGKDVTHNSVDERRRAGLAYIPEDRHRVGTAAGGEVWANLLMGYQRQTAFSKGRWLRRGAVREHAQRLINDYDVRVAGNDSSVATLSGGNLQKVVVAREMGHQAPLLIAEQPTRGVDVGATEFIHSRVLAARDHGAGVLLVSAELWELLALADRILVMFEAVVAELVPPALTRTRLYMTGGP